MGTGKNQSTAQYTDGKITPSVFLFLPQFCSQTLKTPTGVLWAFIKKKLMAKDSYYFKHDSNARNDPKIKALINKYGLEGYGRFWIVIEMLRESSGYKLEDKKYIWDALAEQMKCTIDDCKIFILDCIEEFELFIKDEHFFYSASLLERMIKLDEIRLKRKFAADHRHGNTTKDRWDE